LTLFLCIRRAEQDEKQGVIKHDYVCSKQASARLLIKAARILSAGFLSADVRFAANLRPNFWIGLNGKIAERSIVRRAGPFRQPLQFALLRSGEKFLRALQCALEPARAEIIVPAFH